MRLRTGADVAPIVRVVRRQRAANNVSATSVLPADDVVAEMVTEDDEDKGEDYNDNTGNDERC